MYHLRLIIENNSLNYIKPVENLNINKMKKIVFIVALLATSLISNAEDSIRVMRSLSFGYQYTQFSGLSSNMQSIYGNNFNINGGAFVLSASEFTICHRIMFGGELGGLRSTPRDDNFASAKVMQGFAYFNLGYLVIDKASFMLYPYAGIGGVYSGVSIKNNHSMDITQPEYTIHPGQSGYFSNTALSFNGGVGMRKNITCSKTKHTIQLGLDLGVHITPTNSDFRYNGTRESVSSFGSANSMGYYAKLTIGGMLSAACSDMMMGCKMK
jgi:hypothetical protein